MSFLQSPIAYQGSKRRELPIIEKYQPDTFSTVIDVFGGGGSVSLYYLQKYKIPVVYNDNQKILCDLFETLKDIDKVNKLLEDINSIPKNKETFKELQKKVHKNPENLSEYLFCLGIAFRGLIRSGTINFRKGGDEGNCWNFSRYQKWLKYPKVLSTENFKVENKDCLEIIEEYKDNEDAFLYLDPPYITNGTNNGNYLKPMTVGTMNKIFEIIKNPEYKCKIMLHCDFSGYIYDKLKDYIKHFYPSKFQIGNGSTEKYYKKYQCIITNCENVK